MKLVVCIDGTWNEASTRTNVWKLKQDIDASRGSGVQATYIEGIGTVPGTELLGGMFAADFDRPLGLAYRWLVKKTLNAPDGEKPEIYLFGFSRGAYIAHTLSWLLAEFRAGSPTRFRSRLRTRTRTMPKWRASRPLACCLARGSRCLGSGTP